MWQALRGSRAVAYASLFTSFGTLLCCAIPSTLVLLGFGAALAGFVGQFPQLIWLSEHKELVFGVSFVMLGITYAGQRYAEREACPVDRREACASAKRWSRPLFLVTFLINFVGAFYAFILPRLL
jgi:hypothetical protein